MHGLIERLAGLVNSNSELLRTTIFKIVPMMNPDGVVFGNFRTSLLGVDLNRNFHREEELLFPEVVALKRLGC
jgi:murein tripeptide amidase MpaA